MAAKRALVIRHAAYEDLGGFRAPIEAAGYAIATIDAAETDFAALDSAEPDLLVVLGGPMGVYDQFPWIPQELSHLAQRMGLDRPTLGVCLGAQMMAAALGAEVYAGPVFEMGFHPVELVPPAMDGPLRHLAGVPVLHWHGDTFALPGGVELLASSEVYAHQAFRRGRNLLALQFHAEMGLDPRIETWIERGGKAMARAGIEPAQMRADYRRLGPACVEAGQAMITQWLEELD